MPVKKTSRPRKKAAAAPSQKAKKTVEALETALWARAGELGFGREALALAAEDIGLSEAEAFSLLPSEPMAQVMAFHAWADLRMNEVLARARLHELRIRDRIALAVRVRLEQMDDYREAHRAAVTLLSYPCHLPEGAKALYHTVDAMWQAAGDTSTDYNFYTKRGILACVLATTTLRWLADESDDHADTWAFLADRIENVMQFGRLKSRLTGACRA